MLTIRSLILPYCHRMVGLTKTFHFTTVLMMIALALVAVEFFSMQGHQKSFYVCKEVRLWRVFTLRDVLRRLLRRPA